MVTSESMMHVLVLLFATTEYMLTNIQLIHFVAKSLDEVWEWHPLVSRDTQWKEGAITTSEGRYAVHHALPLQSHWP